jgi:transcription-repair coupling factor (superfamily II helicase)
MAAELEDRFGPIPPLVDTLLRLMELRRWLKDMRVTSAKRRGDAIVLEFDQSTPVPVERLLEVVRGTKGRLKLTSGSALVVQPEAADHDGVIAELRSLLQTLGTP